MKNKIYLFNNPELNSLLQKAKKNNYSIINSFNKRFWLRIQCLFLRKKKLGKKKYN